MLRLPMVVTWYTNGIHASCEVSAGRILLQSALFSGVDRRPVSVISQIVVDVPIFDHDYAAFKGDDIAFGDQKAHIIVAASH